MARELDGASVVVTGAGSGIGQALALEVGDRGARVFLVGRRAQRLEETATLLSGTPPIIVPADTTTHEGRQAVHEAVKRDCGFLDILVNNAGVVGVGRLSAATDDELERMVRTNLLAPACLSRDLTPLLKHAPKPRIVNIGSMFGDIAFPLFAVYSATKFGLRGLSDALRRELAPLGIGVTYAAPRATRTEAAQGFAHLVEPFGMALDSPREVARRVLDAAIAGRPNVYPAGSERLFLLAQRLMPRAFDRAIGRMLDRATSASSNP